MLDLTPLNSQEILISLQVDNAHFPLVEMSGYPLCMVKQCGFACSRKRKHSGPHIALAGHGNSEYIEFSKASIIIAWDEKGIIYRHE